MPPPLLQIDELSVAFMRDGTRTTPVRGVSLTIEPGERVALVGESGCGKSLTALSLVRLAPTDRAHLGGRVTFKEHSLLALNNRQLTAVRGRAIAYVFQDATASLNPVMRVGKQIAECLPHLTRRERSAHITALLERVGLPDPHRAAQAYPCELSGGQQQRVMLAVALATQPELLIADEPTTALDVTTQQQVLDLIDELAHATGMAVLLITHNLGLVAGRMERVYVMYAGEVVESGGVLEVLSHPCHPYTRGLLAAVPLLDAPRSAPLQDIPGAVPDPDAWPPGCAFAPRCPYATPLCHTQPPPVRTRAKRTCRCWEFEP